MKNYPKAVSRLSNLFSGLAITGALAIPFVEPALAAYYEGTYEKTVPYSDMKIEVPYCLTDNESFEFTNNSRNLPAGEEWRYDVSIDALISQVKERDSRCGDIADEVATVNKAKALNL